MPNYFSMHSPTTLPMSRHQIQARCCQMFHLNHLIGQTHSSHLTKLSQQGPTMIEDQLWLTIIEGIISPTQTCKNPGPQASWLNRPQSRSRCQWRPPLPRPDQASVTIISKTGVLCFIIYLTSYALAWLFIWWSYYLVYWILKSYQRSYNTKLRNINSRWSIFNRTSRDAKIQQTKR